MQISGSITKILSAVNQRDEIVVYAEIDTDAPAASYKFEAIGTGNELQPDDSLAFLNTVVLYGGSIVMHIYYEKLN